METGSGGAGVTHVLRVCYLLHATRHRDCGGVCGFMGDCLNV